MSQYPIYSPPPPSRHICTYTHTAPSNVSHILNVTPHYTHTPIHKCTYKCTRAHTQNLIYLCNKIGLFSHSFTPPHSLFFSLLLPPPSCTFPTGGKSYPCIGNKCLLKHGRTHAYACTCTHTHRCAHTDCSWLNPPGCCPIAAPRDLELFIPFKGDKS